jgi:hypothetical protein
VSRDGCWGKGHGQEAADSENPFAPIYSVGGWPRTTAAPLSRAKAARRGPLAIIRPDRCRDQLLVEYKLDPGNRPLLGLPIR